MTDLIERLSDEADLCRNEGADDIARLLEEVTSHGKGWVCCRCGDGILSLICPIPLSILRQAIAPPATTQEPSA